MLAGELMLDTTKNSELRLLDSERIRLIGNDEVSPGGMTATQCFVNAPLFCSVMKQSGGQISKDRFDKIFIDGGIIEEFIKLSSGLLPVKTRPRQSVPLQMAFDPLIYKEMKTIEKHLVLPLMYAGGTFTNNQCLFMAGFLRNFFKLDSVEDVQLLLTYRRNAEPKDLKDVVQAINQFSKRVD